MYRLIARMEGEMEKELIRFNDYKLIDTYWSIVENDDRYIEAMIIRQLYNENPVAIRYREYPERKKKVFIKK